MDRARCVVLIPARGGSKGVPRKAIRTLDERTGETLLSRAINTARDAAIGQVFVSTEDAEIAEHARHGAAAVIDRPAELATDSASTESVILHACGAMPESEAVVLLQCTAPFAQPADLTAAFDALNADAADVVITCVRTHDLLMYESSCGVLIPVNFAWETVSRRQDRPAMYRMAGSVWAYRRDTFIARRKGYGGKIVMVETNSNAIEVDTIQDFLYVQDLIQRRNCVMIG